MQISVLMTARTFRLFSVFCSPLRILHHHSDSKTTGKGRKKTTDLGSVTADVVGRANGKYIEGGRLVIVKGGVKYNMLGQEIK